MRRALPNPYTKIRWKKAKSIEEKAKQEIGERRRPGKKQKISLGGKNISWNVILTH